MSRQGESSLRTRRPSVSNTSNQFSPQKLNNNNNINNNNNNNNNNDSTSPSRSSPSQRTTQPAYTSPNTARPRPVASNSTGSNNSNSNNSNVRAGLLKKRQSVSYHTALESGFNPLSAGASNVPTVPSLPPSFTIQQQQQQQQQGGNRDSIGNGNMAGVGSSSGMNLGAISNAGRGGNIASSVKVEQLDDTGLDIEMLASENFRPEDFLKQHLPMSDRGDNPAQTVNLRALRSRLENAMEITELDLQKSVFKNYAEFVIISKEIANLETEMLELKGTLEEWRAVPDSLEGGFGDDDLLLGNNSSPNRRTQRNSIADLASLYKSQLSALWEGVEGSQKLLPFLPGRHLIAESASFIELNSATYKPKQQVHLFLLNDAMLIAVKKRRGTGLGGKVKLVAERCFILSDIVVVDLKDGGDLTNAVKIKRGKETMIFRTDRAEDKKVLLMAFKNVAEELMNRKRKEMLNEAEARKRDSNIRGGRFDYDGLEPAPGFSPSAILGFGDDDPTGKDLSWIGDYSDELSVTIAMRMFEEAVTLVEKGKLIVPQIASAPHASQLFRAQLDQRTSDLVSALLSDLSEHSIRKTGVVRSTAWLLRLNQGERARETFLTGRGTLVRKRTRQIKFEGDISMYISELAMVSFTLIKNTCEWYMAAFKDNRMASGFVRWASEQVELYAETFRRQVYGADQDRKVIEESLDVTKSHGAMLRDVGLDFSFLLDGLLRPLLPPPRAQQLDVARPRLAPKSAVAQARETFLLCQDKTHIRVRVDLKEDSKFPHHQ